MLVAFFSISDLILNRSLMDRTAVASYVCIFFSILELILNRWLIIENLPVASFTQPHYQGHGQRCGNVSGGKRTEFFLMWERNDK